MKQLKRLGGVIGVIVALLWVVLPVSAAECMFTDFTTFDEKVARECRIKVTGASVTQFNTPELSEDSLFGHRWYGRLADNANVYATATRAAPIVRNVGDGYLFATVNTQLTNDAGEIWYQINFGEYVFADDITLADPSNFSGVTINKQPERPFGWVVQEVRPSRTPTPIPLPKQIRIEGVEIIAQGFNNCGPANLTINLNFYADPTTQTAAAAFLKPNREDRNVSPWQMVDYVNDQTDLRAFFGSGGDLQLLKRLIAAGFPVVIEKGYELPSQGWLGHYLTLFGYDDETGEMVSMDTNLGPWDGSGRYDSYDDIDKYWHQFNHNFFVVYPPDKEQEVFAILGPDMVDSSAMWQQAAQIAQAAIDNFYPAQWALNSILGSEQ